MARNESLSIGRGEMNTYLLEWGEKWETGFRKTRQPRQITMNGLGELLCVCLCASISEHCAFME